MVISVNEETHGFDCMVITDHDTAEKKLLHLVKLSVAKKWGKNLETVICARRSTVNEHYEIFAGKAKRRLCRK